MPYLTWLGAAIIFRGFLTLETPQNLQKTWKHGNLETYVHFLGKAKWLLNHQIISVHANDAMETLSMETYGN